MNVGLFGGTFNPIHQGHIDVITHVKSFFNLNIVHIIPSAIPPHKTSRTLASAKHRLEMVQQAIADIPGLMASDVELVRKGKSFSVDTIRHFKNLITDNTLLYFIIGSDAFFDMNTWKNSVEIFKLTNIIVMCRAGDARRLKDIESFLKNIISPEYKIDKSDNTVKHNDFRTVHICNVPEIHISSTLIREKIRKHESIKGLVAPLVDSFIMKKKLYI
ncbi:MAG: nicotinate (nicotinamide) nucleotide adenylyltransferase [Desulfamplus sp.]|nr:nicotinate (nicotinamide) nucleotide adenylyltransferase [Desulfamplus sp.]MBF0258122.1 nicotinate (nicotinamide) nucleotide adenylyltransferase [Desulfamplus sp.]